jgi:Tfp pilus assembly protein PilF
MRLASRICSAIAAVLLLSPVTQAQLTGGAHGKVTDRDGKPLQGAIVRWENTGLRTVEETKTNKNGAYSISGLYVGKYKATVIVGGHALMVKGEGTGDEILISDNSDRSVNFDLKGAPPTALTSASPGGNAKGKGPDKKTLEEMKAAFNAGNAAMKADNFEEAVKQYQIAAEKDPSQPITLVNLGLAFSNLKKYDDAAAAYRKAIALKPDDADAHAQLSLALANAGKIDEATKEVQEVAKLDRTLAGQYYYNIGAVLTNQRKPKDGLEMFKKAVEVDPKNALSYYELGIAYFASPDTLAQSIAALEKYLELQPAGPEATGARQLLATAKAKAAAGKQ